MNSLNECGVDGRDSAQNSQQRRVLRAARLSRNFYHLRIDGPVAIYFEIPMRQIVGFVPKHYCFQHVCSYACSAPVAATLLPGRTVAAVRADKLMDRIGTEKLPVRACSRS